MTRTVSGVVLGAMLLGLGGCAAALQEDAGGMMIDNTFSVTGWTHRGGSTTYVFAKAFPANNGNTKICGAYGHTQRDGYERLYGDQALGKASLAHNDTRLVQGLAFMSFVSDIKQPSLSGAKCVITGVAWQPAFAEGDLRAEIF